METRSESGTHGAARRRKLIEAFVAYCHQVLLSPQGQSARMHLQHSLGLDGQLLADSPLGLYTNPADVRDHLIAAGFSPAEIHDSKVARDVRLDGRVLVPWRDTRGELKTVAAWRSTGGKRGRPGWLYLNAEERPPLFGIDEALRHAADGHHGLIVVEGMLEAVFFRALGIGNVVATGKAGQLLSHQPWEELSELGVAEATLAFSDDSKGRQRAFDAICEAHRARRCPELFVVPPDAFATARSPATFTRLHGIGQFRRQVERRVHAYHFAARTIVRKHRRGVEWTDAALVEALYEAIRFDALAYRPDRAWALERFFWPHVLGATGTTWDAVRVLLARGQDEVQRTLVGPGSWDLLDSGRLLQELSVRHEAGQIDEFRTLICSAADAIRAARPSAPPPKEAEVPHVVPMRRPAAMEQPQPPLASPPPEAAGPRRRPARCLPPDVATVAYQLWEQKGRPEDADRQCWYEAEQIVAERLEDPAGEDSDGLCGRKSAA
jgi:hypothetical protein